MGSTGSPWILNNGEMLEATDVVVTMGAGSIGGLPSRLHRLGEAT